MLTSLIYIRTGHSKCASAQLIDNSTYIDCPPEAVSDGDHVCHVLQVNNLVVISQIVKYALVELKGHLVLMLPCTPGQVRGPGAFDCQACGSMCFWNSTQ